MFQHPAEISGTSIETLICSMGVVGKDVHTFLRQWGVCPSQQCANMSLFMQINHVEYESRIPGYEALGYCAPSSSAFVVRADALQKCNWLPMHTRASHLALGQELKLQEYLSCFINEPLAVGECCAALCCAVLCCAVLCYAVLCCAVPCYTVLRSTALCSAVLMTDHLFPHTSLCCQSRSRCLHSSPPFHNLCK